MVRMGERRESEIHVVSTVGTPTNEFTRTLTGQDFARVDVALNNRVLSLYVNPDGEWELESIMGMRWSEANEAPDEAWRMVGKGRIE